MINSLGLLKAKMSGVLVIPEGKSILIPMGEGLLLQSKTIDFGIINSPVSLSDGRRRNTDKIQVRFHVDMIQKINLDDYLPRFVYFETVTIHLLSLIHADNIGEYYSKQAIYRDVTLMDRVSELRGIAKAKNISSIGKLTGLLEVRNEIAHNLYPIAISYNETTYPYDDAALVDRIKKDSMLVMRSLLKLYDEYVHKLEGWIQPILDEVPAQVALMSDGSIETHDKQY